MSAPGPNDDWAPSVVSFLSDRIPMYQPGEWSHAYISAYEMGCEALAALGQAKEVDGGAHRFAGPRVAQDPAALGRHLHCHLDPGGSGARVGPQNPRRISLRATPTGRSSDPARLKAPRRATKHSRRPALGAVACVRRGHRCADVPGAGEGPVMDDARARDLLSRSARRLGKLPNAQPGLCRRASKRC